MANVNAPCKGCQDRYLACSDHCRKPEFLQWREGLARSNAAKARNRGLDSYTVDAIAKSRGRRK